MCHRLTKAKHKAEAISRELSQEQRNKVYKNLKNNVLKVLVSTDLTARGVDAPNVSVVVNMGPPSSPETYFHRIGRAGRFGGHGVGITILSTKNSAISFLRMSAAGKFKIKLLTMDQKFPKDLMSNQAFFDSSRPFDETVLGLIEMQKDSGVEEVELFPKPVEAPIPLDVFTRKNLPNEGETSTIALKTEERNDTRKEENETDKKPLGSKIKVLQEKLFGRSTKFGTSSIFKKEAKKEEDSKVEEVTDKLASLKVIILLFLFFTN